MGDTAGAPAPVGHALERVARAVVREAAGLSGAYLVELLVARDGAPRAPGLAPPWRSAAFAAPHLARSDRGELAREIARSPAAAELPQVGRLVVLPLATCESGLARLLRHAKGEQVFAPVRSGASLAGWLRVVLPGPADRAALRTCRALARQAADHFEAASLRGQLAERHRLVAREATREKRALAALAEAKETLRALNLAGTQLMVETDANAIAAVICRELTPLGFQAAVLARDDSGDGGRAFRYVRSSFDPALQSATERVLGRTLDALRIDPRTVPLVARVLRQGRTVFTARAREAARQLFGGATPAQLRKLARLLGLRNVVVAPLRYGVGISGLLVVAAARLRRSDPEAIDAFALQASVALERARLFSELRAHEAQLESEVERRTRELTRAVRALEELDRRKDNFLANVSHELRTPLVTVLGYSDLLLSEKLGELNARQRSCLRIVSTSGRRLRSFIEELLELSRYELTRDGLEPSFLDLRELVRHATLALAPRFHERGLVVRTRVAPGTPLAWGDRERLLQVLMNLLSNAIQSCDVGCHLRVAAARGRDGRVELSVSDDGPGIPQEHLSRIFDRLYQVGDVMRRRERGAGLGLGLTIARNIVQAHGGSISVRSRVGAGTRFRFWLPPAPASAPRPAPWTGAPQVEDGSAR